MRHGVHSSVTALSPVCHPLGHGQKRSILAGLACLSGDSPRGPEPRRQSVKRAPAAGFESGTGRARGVAMVRGGDNDLGPKSGSGKAPITRLGPILPSEPSPWERHPGYREVHVQSFVLSVDMITTREPIMSIGKTELPELSEPSIGAEFLEE